MFGKTSLQVPMLEKRSRQRFLPNSERRWNNSTRAQQTYEQKNPNQTILQKDSNLDVQIWIIFWSLLDWLVSCIILKKSEKSDPGSGTWLPSLPTHEDMGQFVRKLTASRVQSQNDTEMTGNQGLREQKSHKCNNYHAEKMFQGRRFCAPNVKPKTTPNPQRRGAKTMTLSLSIVVFRIALGRCSYD